MKFKIPVMLLEQIEKAWYNMAMMISFKEKLYNKVDVAFEYTGSNDKPVVRNDKIVILLGKVMSCFVQKKPFAVALYICKKPVS